MFSSIFQINDAPFNLYVKDTPEITAKINNLFTELDDDGSGDVDMIEFIGGLRDLGCELSEVRQSISRQKLGFYHSYCRLRLLLCTIL